MHPGGRMSSGPFDQNCERDHAFILEPSCEGEAA